MAAAKKYQSAVLGQLLWWRLRDCSDRVRSFMGMHARARLPTRDVTHTVATNPSKILSDDERKQVREEYALLVKLVHGEPDCSGDGGRPRVTVEDLSPEVLRAWVDAVRDIRRGAMIGAGFIDSSRSEDSSDSGGR
jgi:hypothetical protein